MRKPQTSEDGQKNRPAQFGDREVPPLSHDDYDPKVEWRMEESRHIIRLNVEGFKKEQLRVQANTILKEVIVTGERPQDGGRSVKFRKTFQLDGNLYKMDAIRAKLRHGFLDIILPLKEPQQSVQSPVGEESIARVDINRGPNPDADASRGSSLGLTIEKKRTCRILAVIVIASSVIGLGAFLTYRFLVP